MSRRSSLTCSSVLAGLVAVGGCQGTGAEGDAASSASSGSETEADTGGEFVPLVDHGLWQQLEAAADPLAEHRPDTVECGIAGWYVENEQLEVDTNFCNYLGLGQPSLVSLSEGQRVRLGMYHFDLVAPEPALAHVAILVDGELLWEDEIEIPGSAQVYSEEFESPISAAAGSEVVFHLHNHGQNTWVLQELMTEQAL